MSRVYELPTHLSVEDHLLAGLTTQQVVRLAIGATLTYGLWDQAPWLPTEVRLVLCSLIIVASLAAALLRPGDRSIDEWAFAAVLFGVRPRRLAWRAGDEQPQSSSSPSGWADLEPEPGWLRQPRGRAHA
jgi:hypothetical protein